MPRKERLRRSADAMERFRLRHPERVTQSLERYARLHPEAIRATWKRSNKKRYNALTPEQKRKKRDDEKARRRAIQQEAITHYGGKCYCCGEIIRLLLALDHKNGGGCKHRKELQMSVAEWAKKNGWPDVLRVACHNCNFGAHLNGGICPHQAVN